MLEHPWTRERNKTIICLDSYHNGVPVGRIYGPSAEAVEFQSLTQFLIKMEAILDDNKMPQSFTSPRTFAAIDPVSITTTAPEFQRGQMATFTLQVLFRQHTSWQGVITWTEERMEQSFRSVMELILLMDSALRPNEEPNSD